MLTITEVRDAGIASELDLQPGDRLVSVNGQPLDDFLDLLLAERLEDLVLLVEKADGDLWQLEIEKEADDDLGLAVQHPDPRQCGNQCLFCFVHQLPRGMRPSLYIKDEDYRFSYLYGAYVTLSNIDAKDIDRIIARKLTPLYISVHATNEPLRTRLLGRQAPPILPLLQQLTAHGIELHTQIVLCPGLNDGDALEQTVADLYALAPMVRSLAVVPVGLTGHRQRLPALRTPTQDEATACLTQIQHWQQRALSELGSRFLFAADELYLKAGVDIPPVEDYEDLPQIENGVGQVAYFRMQAEMALDEAATFSRPLRVATFTGTSFAPELAQFLAALQERTGCTVNLYPVKNRFFGGEVSVTGLLTGQDVLARLQGCDLGIALLVPDVVLRDGAEVFLDDLSLADLERKLSVPCLRIPSTPFGILDALEELAGPMPDSFVS